MSEKIEQNSEVLPEIDRSASGEKIKKENKPGKSRFVETKPSASRTAEPKTNDSKTVEPKPGDPKPGADIKGEASSGELKIGELKPDAPKPAELKPGKSKPPKNNRWTRLRTYQKFLIIFFSTIFFLAACGTGGFYYYLNSLNRTLSSGTTTQIQNVLAPVDAEAEKTMDAPVTILLLGRDTRDAETEQGRTDTIMLLHIDPTAKSASLLSIPRDTLVDIPGYGQDKINAAYAYGGEELMIKTVSIFLDAVINHYATIDFEGFVKLVDELGGVDVTIDRPIIDPKTNAYIAAGNHHFTGEQALSYSRSRSTEFGDIGRIQRQQLIFKELIKQKLDIKYISNINSYLNILIDNIRTDMDLMTIMSYAKSALAFGTENISSAIIPSRPDWIDNGTKSVQIPDIVEARAMWQRIIFNQPTSTYGIEYTGGTENIPESMSKNKVYIAKIKVKNTGATAWERGGPAPFYLSYHWLDFDTKKAIVFDGERSLLVKDKIYPGEEVEMDLKIKAPQEPGNYILQVDMVHEGVTWFSYQGVPPLEKYVSVNIDYAAAYDDMGTTPNKVLPGQQFTTQVKVTNNGFMEWVNKAKDRFDLGAHWYNRDTREVVIFDADSGELPNNVNHGESATVNMIITAPAKPGRYVLAYDLVHETVTWFSQQGVIPMEISIDVGYTLDTALVKKTNIFVYNGSGVAGAATKVADYLSKYGFKITGKANAKNNDFEKTLVIYKPDKAPNAGQLAMILNSYQMEEYSQAWAEYDSGADIILILGKDVGENMKWQ
jgi:LCP family protein required for cell wall assembly